MQLLFAWFTLNRKDFPRGENLFKSLLVEFLSFIYYLFLIQYLLMVSNWVCYMTVNSLYNLPKTPLSIYTYIDIS